MDNSHYRPLRFICIIIILLMIFSSFTGVLAGLSENPILNVDETGSSQDEYPINDLKLQNEKLAESMILKEIPGDADSDLKVSKDISPNEETYNIPVIFPRPQMQLVDGYTQVQIEGCESIGTPSEPKLPEKRFSFKFSPGTTFQKIEFIPDDIS